MGTKERLLSLLEQHKGEYLSGEDLASRLQVSRTAVWKAVNALRAAGYGIDAAQNRGYCLDVHTDILSREGILKLLEGIQPDIDFENETALIDDSLLESFDVIQIVTSLMDEFDISIDADDIEPENLNSLDAICAMVERKLAER